MPDRLEVLPIGHNRARREAFLRFPWRVYRDWPAWVPPLLFERRRFLSAKHNPFFRHSAAELFLARRDGEVVGTIAAIQNRRHLETYGDGTGFFGFFECLNEPAVAHALLDRAAAWLRERGLARVRGPASFTINDECGLLLDTFDLAPVVLMPYNPPYYRDLLEGWGLARVEDLLAFRLDTPEKLPARLARAREIFAAQHEITLRCADFARFDAEIDRIHRHTVEVGIRRGYRWAELSWILESNRPMRRVLERLGARVYKTYRMYERAL